MLYVDSDAFLALVKQQDHLKHRAYSFFKKHPREDLVTSSLALLELWFYYYKNRLPYIEESLGSVRGMVKEVWPLSDIAITASLRITQKAPLSPADAIHAAFALTTDGIVSTDNSYDQIEGLRRIHF